MNEHNLIVPSSEEARKNGRKGGIKSGEARRRKRDLRAAMKELLSLPVCDTELWNAISAMGVNPADLDNNQALVVAIFRKALSGDVAAFREIRNLIGEDNDAERLKLQKKQALDKNHSDDGMLSEVLAALRNDDLAR